MTTTNDWDLVFAGDAEFFTRTLGILYQDNNIPHSISFSSKGVNVQADIGSPEVALDPGQNDGNGTLNVTVPIPSGTVTVGSKQTPISGSLLVQVQMSAIAVSTVIQQYSLAVGGSTGAYASCGAANTISAGAATLEAWIQTTSQDTQTLLSFGPNDVLSLSLQAGQPVATWAGETYMCSRPVTLADGLWHHVAVVFDGGGQTVSFYADGQLASQAVLGDTSSTAGTSFSIGGAPNAPSLSGAITGVRVWSVARAASDIQLTMNASLGQGQQGLVAAYGFDGTVENEVNGQIGGLEGGATLHAEEGTALPYILFLYFLEPSGVFTVTSNLTPPSYNSMVEQTAQTFLDGISAGVFRVLAQGTATDVLPTAGSLGVNYPYAPMLPTTSSLAVLTAGAQTNVLALMMTDNTIAPPSPAEAFQGDNVIDAPSGCNFTTALSDYALFERLAVPALSARLGVSTSAFTVTQDPAVLTLDQNVTVAYDGKSITITSLTMYVTREGIYVGAHVQATAVDGSVSMTVNASVTDDDGHQIVVSMKDPSVSLSLTPEATVFIEAITLFFLGILGPLLVALANALLGLAAGKIASRLAGKDWPLSPSFKLSKSITLEQIAYADGVIGYFELAEAPDAEARETSASPRPGALSTGATPAISSFSPGAGTAGTSVTVYGSGFTGAQSVTIGGVGAAVFRVKNDGEVNAKVGPGATTGPVVVTTPSDPAVSKADFIVLAGPSIASFTPTSGSPGTRVTLSGSGFTGATAVLFDGTAATAFTVANDGTTITATVPTGATSGPLSVGNPAGTASSTSPFDVTSSGPPVLDDVSPSSGSLPASVTIHGSCFTGTTAVSVNGTPASFSLISDTQINATVARGTTSGPITVTNMVTNTARSTTGLLFTVVPAPSISQLSTTSGKPEGKPGTQVMVTGSGLSGATLVAMGRPLTKASFTPVSDQALSVAVPSGICSGPVSVTTPNGTAVSQQLVTVISTGRPTVGTFSPASGGVGTPVTVSGSSFTGATRVTVGGKQAAFSLSSDSALNLIVPSGATTGPIMVTNTAGPGNPSTTNFTVLALPSIGGFSPTHGKAGTQVMISGSNFTGATEVLFGNGAVRAQFTVNNDKAITANVPSGAVDGPIAISSPAGVGTSEKSSFTVSSSTPPVIDAFDPQRGQAGTLVTLTGSGFTGTETVTFNGQPAASVLVLSDTTMRVRAPKNVTSGPISITNTLLPPATSQESFVVSPSVRANGGYAAVPAAE